MHPFAVIRDPTGDFVHRKTSVTHIRSLVHQKTVATGAAKRVYYHYLSFGMFLPSIGVTPHVVGVLLSVHGVRIKKY